MLSVTGWNSAKPAKTGNKANSTFLGGVMVALGAMSFADGIGIQSLPGSLPVHGATGEFATIIGPFLLGFGIYVAVTGIKDRARSRNG